MNETKTGALVCKMPDAENQIAYKPLAFVTGIPGSYSDSDFKANFDLSIIGALAASCIEVIFRADIHATSNEVQEEFELLHDDSSLVPKFAFVQKQVAV